MAYKSASFRALLHFYCGNDKTKKPIYESLYELSDDDDVVGLEGSANGKTDLENGDGFVKISKETLLWIVIGSSVVSLGKS